MKNFVLPIKYRVRLQNSPYFWVFKYARAVKKKVWNEDINGQRETLRLRKTDYRQFCSLALGEKVVKSLRQHRELFNHPCHVFVITIFYDFVNSRDRNASVKLKRE